MTNTNRTEIGSLRAFAVSHNELEFAHLCTAALQSLQGDEREQWALERVLRALDRIRDNTDHVVTEAWQDEHGVTPKWATKLAVIRATDTTRPDGATARKMSAPV